ncbi:MAG: hypothetical protein ACOYN3_02880 [Acidimicrobiia bacterium]
MAELSAGDEPEVAIVFTPEPWVGTLHHFLADHGGARVREIVMDQRLALEDGYDVLVVSHRWPALTRSFVRQLHDRNRKVLGVYDGDEPTSRVFLANLGVDGVVASAAPMAEFLEAIEVITPDRISPLTETVFGESEPAPSHARGLVIAIGGPTGAGKTEVACALHQLAQPGTHVLVDADDLAPAVAQRMSLAIEPNIRTAIDAVAFGLGHLETVTQTAPTGAIVCGIPNVTAWGQVRAPEVIDVIDELAAHFAFVLVDVSGQLEDLDTTPRERNAVTRSVIERADRIAVVVDANPRGIARAINWAAEFRGLATHATTHAILNRTTRDRFRRSECIDELQRAFTFNSIHVVPEDVRVSRAHWEGTAVAKGPFLRSMRPIAATLFTPVEVPEIVDLTIDRESSDSLIEATA